MRPAFFALIVGIAATPAMAQNPDYCGVALTERAYDRVNASTQSRIMFSARDDLCNREFNSVSEARRAARDQGFNLAYEGFGIGSSNARQTSSEKWSISDTSFCMASATDLERVFESQYDSEIASTAVKAWLDCVRSSNQNSLFLDYDVSRDGQLFSGTLRTSASVGTLSREITGFAVVGAAKDTVRCNVAGRWYNPNDALNQPIVIEQTGTAIACEKTGDEGVRVAFQTSADSTPFISLPSKREIDLDAMENRLEGLEQELSRFRGGVIAFDRNSCPTGFEPYPGAFGRFIRGLDLSGDVDPNREVGTPQEDSIISHDHTLSFRSIDGVGYNVGSGHGVDRVNRENTTLAGSGETRPKNVALLYCERTR